MVRENFFDTAEPVRPKTAASEKVQVLLFSFYFFCFCLYFNLYLRCHLHS